MKTREIERIDWPCADLFRREYVEAGKPVIVNRGLGACAAASWTPDYLCSVIGQKRVKVAVSPDGESFSFTTDGSTFQYQDMELSAVVPLMEAPGAAKYYVMQIPVREALPELMVDIHQPPAIEPGDLRALNFWFGGTGNITPVHFDYANNFLAQIHGRKEISLFAPDQSVYLYPLPLGPHGHVSQVNFLRPDLDRFPMIEQAVGMHLVLNPGDLLFIPAFWWHGVKSLSMSISLNFWWKTVPSQIFVPIMLERLAKLFDHGRLKHLALGGGGLIEAAARALQQTNLAWAASLLAAAALEERLQESSGNSDAPVAPGTSRVDVLKAEIAKLGNGDAIDSRKVDSWMQIVEAAHAADDSRLVRKDVVDMVEDIGRFIGLSARAASQ